MRKIIIALLILAVPVLQVIGAETITNSATTTDVRFNTFNSATGVDIGVEFDYQSWSGLLESVASNDNTPLQTEPVIRWVVLPDHGTAKVIVQSINVAQSGAITDSQISEPELQRFARLGKPQIMRGVRMAPLAVMPAARGDNGQTIVARDLTLKVEFSNEIGQNEVAFPAKSNAVFESAIRNATLNPPAHMPGRDLADPYSGKMLILRPSTLEDEAALASLDEFVDWKRKTGLDVTLENVNVQDLEPSEIRDIIREGYPDDPYDYVIIVGWYFEDTRWPDWPHLDESCYFPAFPFDAIVEDNVTTYYGDVFYSTLDNENDETEDWMPDVLLGRIVVQTPEALPAILDRQMRYERDPYDGPEGEEGDWYRRALACTDDVDTVRSPLPDIEFTLWARNILNSNGFSTTHLIGQRFDVVDDERETLENGVSFAVTNGYFYGMIDSTDEDGEWDVAMTGRMHPFIVTNPYWYGFPRLFPFYNQGTIDEPQGPIGAVALAFDHWVAENRYVCEGATAAYIRSEDRSSSSLLLGGVQSILGLSALIDPESADYTELKIKYTHMMLLGDPSTKLYHDLPGTMTTDLPETLYPGATAVAFRITDGEDNPVSNATVCVSQSDRIHLVGYSDNDGDVAITVPQGLAEGTVDVVVSKQDFRTFNGSGIPVEYPAVNLFLRDFSPETMVNGSEADLSLTIENDGDEDGSGLDVGFHSDSPFLTFSRQGAALDDIASGEDGGLASAVRLTLASSCPGGTVIQVLLNMASREDAWQAAFEITTSGPRYVVPGVEVVYENLAPGEEATVEPRLYNLGDRRSIALNATLVSLSDHVTVIDADRAYPAIDPDGSVMPDTPFRIAVDDLFVPGQPAEFELHLVGENDVDVTLQFTKRISSADEGDPVGPDNYGYYAFDSGDSAWAEAPVYRWYEISYQVPGFEFHGDKLDLPDDGALRGSSTIIELPFPFTYYGEEYDSLVVCSNGWVSFDPQSVDFISPNGEGIPGIVAPSAQIAVCWQDIDNPLPWLYGIFTYTEEDAGLFIIEWCNLEQEPGAAETANFQIILYDPAKFVTPTGDGEIKLQYKNYQDVEGDVLYHPFATIGIRSPDGTDGVQYRHAYSYSDAAHSIQDDFAIKFTSTVENSRGLVRGRFVRFEDQQQGIEGVHILSYRGIDVTSAEDGSFEFPIRVGQYDNIRANVRYFSDMSLSFQVLNGEVTDLGNLGMTHPEIANVPEAIRTELQPDARTRQHIDFDNHGNGELEYKSTIVHFDGTHANFTLIDSSSLATLGDRNAFSPVYVSPYIYVPHASGGNQVLTGLDIHGQRTGEEIPQPGRDTLDGGSQSITWDGNHFWGSFRYINHPNEFVEFDRQGNLIRSFASPIDSLGSFEDEAFITFSPTRESMFAVKFNVQRIFEISLDSLDFGQIINSWPIAFPGDQLNPSGIGWNKWDTDGMPLYILDKYIQNVVGNLRGQRVVRFNPENGEYSIFAYARNVNTDADRFSAGISFLNDYSEDFITMVTVEKGANAAANFLKFQSVGPNIPYISGAIENAVGTVDAGGHGQVTIPFDATGFEERDYLFGLQIKHNGVGDSVTVPVTLHVNRNASAPDDRVTIPITFGITKLYPNPFNSRIGIDYVTPAGSRSILKIFDLQGREVATLHDGLSKVGRERIFWNADGVATGVYIVRLEADSKVMSRKVALIK